MKRQESILTIRDFNNLLGFQIAQKLEAGIDEVTMKFPKSEKNLIVDQIVRAAGSIKKEIAKGEQLFIREKFYHYSISIGSAKEVSAWLEISYGQKYISEQEYQELEGFTQSVVRLLTKTLQNIKKNEGADMKLRDPKTPNVKNFEAYKKALLLTEKVYQIAKEPLIGEDLSSKLLRCVTAVPANVAEAQQFYLDKKVKFLNTAMKELSVLKVLLESALRREQISLASYSDAEPIIIEIEKILMKTISNHRSNSTV